MYPFDNRREIRGVKEPEFSSKLDYEKAKQYTSYLLIDKEKDLVPYEETIGKPRRVFGIGPDYHLEQLQKIIKVFIFVDELFITAKNIFNELSDCQDELNAANHKLRLLEGNLKDVNNTIKKQMILIKKYEHILNKKSNPNKKK